MRNPAWVLIAVLVMPLSVWGEEAEREEKNWERVEKYMQTHSPQRYEAFSRLDPEDQQRMREYIMRRYHWLLQMDRDEGEVYERRVEQTRLEDEEFGLAQRYRKARTDEEKRQIEEELRVVAERLVEMQIEDRQRRIESLKQRLDRTREQLEQDMNNRDELVEDRIDRLTKDDERRTRRGFRGRGREQDDTEE